ncbi:MAG: hypothetical protein Q8918_01265 [Bacteroidota bacterium]|nr:hypothetical protein [Bacteroidota bacterium]MDP4248717.1 hypothetical protein [Bacteroidota bacterium]
MKDHVTIRKFLIAAYEAFAKGIQSSLDIIIGPAENVFLIQAYLDGNKSVDADQQKVWEQVNSEDKLVIFSNGAREADRPRWRHHQHPD